MVEVQVCPDGWCYLWSKFDKNNFICIYIYTHIPNALISLASVSLGFAIQSRMKKFNAFLLLKKQKNIKTQQIIFKKTA